MKERRPQSSISSSISLWSDGQMSSLIMSHGVFLITALLHFFLLHNSVSCAGRWHLHSSTPFKVLRMCIFAHLIRLLRASLWSGGGIGNLWNWQGAEGDKIRLGSTPPSCHNRCNACNPCKAIQIPTVPVPIGQVARLGVENRRPLDQQAYSQYNSNYKPLEWKCSCGARIFNP